MKNQIIYRTAEEAMNIVTNYHDFTFNYDSNYWWIVDFKITDMQKSIEKENYRPEEFSEIDGSAKFRVIVDVRHLVYEYDEQENILNENNLEEFNDEWPFEWIEEIIKESLLNKFNDGLIDSRLL